MDKNQIGNNYISFVIAVNDEIDFNKSKKSIGRLIEQPDIVKIKNVKSIFNAYDKGTKLARNNIICYMHQDVELRWPNNWHIIINKYFSEKKTGFIGVAGSKSLTKLAVWWEKDFSGGGYTGQRVEKEHNEQYHLLGDLGEVLVLDGVMLITTKKVLKKIGGWSKDKMEGWDFYDISATFRAHLKGFRNYTVPLTIKHKDIGEKRPEWYNAKKKWAKKYKKYLPRSINP